MVFTYLTLPMFPSNLIPACLENMNLIDKDSTLFETVNKNRGPANYGTWLTEDANQWLLDHIAIPYFSPLRPEMKRSLLNVTFYAKNKEKPEFNGQQGPHRDIGRNWALNYIFDTGGDNVTTRWYDDNKCAIAETVIQPNRWCLLKVDNLHAVKNLKLGRLRTFISMDLSIKENEDFNALEYFRHVVDYQTVLTANHN